MGTTEKSGAKRWIQGVWITPLVLAAYLVAYYALARPDYVIFYSPVAIYGGAGTKPLVTYRFGGDIAKRIFAPAHRLDRLIRPKKWRNPM